jgi:hypothetical protein
MKDRARAQIDLIFRVDDFERALALNTQIVEATTSRFSGKIDERDLVDLERKLSADMLMLLEMSRHMHERGKALIKQAEKVAQSIPDWEAV